MINTLRPRQNGLHFPDDIFNCIFFNENVSISLRPRQNSPHFPDDIFKWIFFNENAWILIKISLKFVPKGQINNIHALVLIMAWRWPGDKPLSEPMMVSLLTFICVTRPQTVKYKGLKLDNKSVCRCTGTKLCWAISRHSADHQVEHVSSHVSLVVVNTVQWQW